jgi:Transposase and inactivated derivatives
LTPKKYQSGETDYTGRISKHGDASVREALYEAAHLMLTKPIKGCSKLKSWAMRIARRAGTNKAKVALARKLAVIMLRMLKDNVPFNPAAKASNGLNGGQPVFGRAPHQALPEAKSLRRDDGPGQAVMRVVDASNDAITLSADWPACSSHEPHQATALRRSRTEASARRVDDAKRD